MWNTFKYTLKSLSRTPGVIIWCLLFPLVMATLFMMMFAGIDKQAEIEQANVVVVEPDSTPEGLAFRGFLEGVSSDNEQGVLSITWVESLNEAERLVEATGGDTTQVSSENKQTNYVGYIELGADGKPQVHLLPSGSPSSIDFALGSVVVLLMDTYTANAVFIRQLIEDNPKALADTSIIEQMFAYDSATKQVQLTHYKPKESVRYYFALLGMAGMFGASAGLFVINRLRANSSALGARRNVGGTSHAAMLAGTFIATWLVCFICLVIAFAYMKFVVGVDFGDRDGMCILAIALSSLCAVSFGCAISTIPKIPAPAKDGIVSAVVCIGALFAGLYGTFAMDMANTISTNFPIGEIINPVADIAQTFYAILYFDSLDPFFKQLAILGALTCVFFLISLNSFRRTRYASL